MPIGQGRIRRKVRESNPGHRAKRGQLIARPLSGRLPSPIGLTFRTKRLRQKGSNLHPLLNRRVDYRYLMPDQESGWPDLNRRSRAPDDHAAHGARRNSRLSYILPASPKQIVLPSNILRRSPTNRPAQDPEAAQRESNPHFRHGKATGRRGPTFGRCPLVSYRPKRKKPDVVVTPGFRYSRGIGTAKCHMRNG